MSPTADFLPAAWVGLFRRELYREPRLTGRGALGQTAIAFCWMLFGTALLSVVPGRRPPHEPMGLGAAACFALLAGGYYLYRSVWRPWRDGPAEYRWVGELTVRDKSHIFSVCHVWLAPGQDGDKPLRIERALYEQLRIGSRVRLVYTRYGELVSIIRLEADGGNGAAVVL